MALIDRLMGITPPKISVHAFFAAQQQRITGQLSRAEVIAMFELDADAVTEYDALAALAPTGSSAAAEAKKALFLEAIHSILILAEGDYLGFRTIAEVKTRLGI